MQKENGSFRSRVVDHHSSERDVLVDLEEIDIGFLVLLGESLGMSGRDGAAEHGNGCEHSTARSSGGCGGGADTMAAMEVDLFRALVHDPVRRAFTCPAWQ